MTLAFKLGCVWYCLFYFNVYRANAATTFEIQRGKYDTFQNVQCQTSQSYTKGQCKSYKAQCVDNKCKRCKCNENGRNTFVMSGSNTGKCTKDENIIPESDCTRFQNSRFMLYLDNETCHENPCSHQFSAPNFSGNRNCSIYWKEFEILHSSDAAWQNISYDKQLFFIQRKLNHTKILKVDREALEIFNGSLLRLVIACKVKNYSANQCLLLKFKSLQRNTRGNVDDNNPTATIRRNRTITLPSITRLSTSVRLSITTTPSAAETKTNNTEEISTTLMVLAVLVWVVVAVVWVAILSVVCFQRRRRRGHPRPNKNYNIRQGQNQTPLLPSLNESEPSTSNQPTQGDFDEPNEHLYEYAVKTAFTLPPPSNHNSSSGDGSLRNNQTESRELEETGEYVIQPDTEEGNAHDGDYVIKNPDPEESDTQVPPQIPQYDIPTSPQYKYPDESQSYEHGCPSHNNSEADAREKTNACVQNGAYSPLARLPLNKNESDNGGSTSLNREERKNEKGDDAEKKEKELELLQYVDVIDSYYTPLAKLRDNESEVPVYQPLLKNKQEELKKPV